MALRESWTNIHLHICLFHSWQIFTYLPLYDNKYFCVCSLWQICLYNTYLFIFDEEVILSPTPHQFIICLTRLFWRLDVSYKGNGTRWSSRDETISLYIYPKYPTFIIIITITITIILALLTGHFRDEVADKRDGSTPTVAGTPQVAHVMVMLVIMMTMVVLVVVTMVVLVIYI